MSVRIFKYMELNSSVIFLFDLKIHFYFQNSRPWTGCFSYVFVWEISVFENYPLETLLNKVFVSTVSLLWERGSDQKWIK